MNMQSVMKLLIRYVDSRTCKGTLQVKYDIDSCVVDFIPVTPYIRSDYVETTFMRKAQEEWVYDISFLRSNSAFQASHRQKFLHKTLKDSTVRKWASKRDLDISYSICNIGSNLEYWLYNNAYKNWDKMLFDYQRWVK